MAYEVVIAQSVLDALSEGGGEVLEGKFFDCMGLIGSFPEIGGEYLPQDGDDEPPVPCRHYPIPGTTKTIYYSVDHAREAVAVFGLVDQRRNPAYRFREVKQSGWLDIG